MQTAFSEIVGNLVWVKEDAENALLQALEECEHPDAPQWKTDATLRQRMVAELMDVDNDALTQLVQDGLLTLALRSCSGCNVSASTAAATSAPAATGGAATQTDIPADVPVDADSSKEGGRETSK